MSVCIFVKSNGNQCKAPSLLDDEYCYFHSEKYKAQRDAASARGGKATKYLNPDGTEDVEDPEDRVVDALNRVIDMLEAQKNTPEVARGLTQALLGLDRVLERRDAKRANIIKIEVEYVNDWRRETSYSALPS